MAYCFLSLVLIVEWTRKQWSTLFSFIYFLNKYGLRLVATKPPIYLSAMEELVIYCLSGREESVFNTIEICPCYKKKGSFAMVDNHSKIPPFLVVSVCAYVHKLEIWKSKNKVAFMNKVFLLNKVAAIAMVKDICCLRVCSLFLYLSQTYGDHGD